MTVRIEQLCHMIVFLRFHTDHTHTAAMMRGVGIRRHAFDVAGIGNRDHTGMTRDQVRNIDIAVIVCDLGAAFVRVAFFHIDEFFLDEIHAFFTAGKQFTQIFDLLHDLIIIFLQIFNGKTRQLMQTHIQNGVHLDLGETEPFAQSRCRHFTGAGFTDDLHHFINIVHRDQQTFQNVCTCFRFLEFKLRTARDHFKTVIQKRLKDLRQIHHFRTVVIHHQKIAADHRFQLTVGIKLIQHHTRHGSALDVDHNADAFFLAGNIPQTADAGDLLFTHQFRDLFDHEFLVHSIGDLGNNDLFLAVLFHDLRFRTDFDHTVTRFVHGADGIDPANDGSCGKVRSRQTGHQFTHGGGGMFHQINSGIHHFPQVVSGDIGRHPHTDPDTAVHQQIGKFCRKHFRFHGRFVEGGDHIHRFFFNIAEQFIGNAFHTALGITVSRRRVAVDRPEVALPFHQRRTHGEILRHTHQRIVNRGVAVRMVITKHFTHHFGTLHRGVGFGQPHLTHGVKDTAVTGFHAVADIRDGTADIDTQRVLQIRSMHDILDIHKNIIGGILTHFFFFLKLPVELFLFI